MKSGSCDVMGLMQFHSVALEVGWKRSKMFVQRHSTYPNFDLEVIYVVFELF